MQLLDRLGSHRAVLVNTDVERHRGHVLVAGPDKTDDPHGRTAHDAHELASSCLDHGSFLSFGVRPRRPLPIDNNGVEPLMKQIATGRENWLFIGSVRAGERNAKLMSLFSGAHRHDLDVELYLADITRQILSRSTDYGSMLPHVWKQSHPDAVRQYRIEERRDKADRSP
jgi:hypothetical protein